jgi:hypothetical protein
MKSLVVLRKEVFRSHGLLFCSVHQVFLFITKKNHRPFAAAAAMSKDIACTFHGFVWPKDPVEDQEAELAFLHMREISPTTLARERTIADLGQFETRWTLSACNSSNHNNRHQSFPNSTALAANDRTCPPFADTAPRHRFLRTFGREKLPPPS